MIFLKRCIYCGTEKELTKSDIIPDSITTAKCLNDNVCKKCNNLTNTKFENKFANYFSFVRNQLGYTKRGTNIPVSFQADIYINKVPTLYNKPTTKYRFTTYKDLMTNGCIIKDGKIIGFKNAHPKYHNLEEPRIIYVCQVNHKTLFFSKETLRTVAKICFEWHCLQNSINDKHPRYDRIRNFILGRGYSGITIIEDDFFFEDTTKMFQYIPGSHALLEYQENGTVYVLFTFFGIVWYKVKICKTFRGGKKLNILHQYSLDKEIRENKSNAMSFSLNRDLSISETSTQFFSPPKTIKVREINPIIGRRWQNSMTQLISGMILTYFGIKRNIELLKKDNFLGQSEIYYYDMLNYHENIKINTVMLLYYLGKNGYDNRIYFSKNMTIIYSSVQKNETALNFWEEMVVGLSFVNFIENLKKGVSLFESIPPQSR